MINRNKNSYPLNVINYPIVTDKTATDIENNIYFFAVEKNK